MLTTSVLNLVFILTTTSFLTVSSPEGGNSPESPTPSASTRIDRSHAIDPISKLGSIEPSIAPWSNSEVELLAREAYVWGWPLVYLHNCRKSMSLLKAPGVSGGSPVAPPNELSMLADHISPLATVVPCPNQDVVYGFGVFDLNQSEVVLQVPDFGDRFWLYQLGDHRTESFADVGRQYATKPGHYLIVGPNWTGVAPEGIEAILRSPTSTCYCIPRVFMDGSDEDREEVQEIISRIHAYPVARYNKKWKTKDWKKSKWYPATSSSSADRHRWVNPETFFDHLADVLDEVPPLEGEEATYERLRSLVATSNQNPALRQSLIELAARTEKEMIRPLFEFRNVGHAAKNGWTTVSNGAKFGKDYLTRTAVAKSNIFVNQHHEAKYYYLDVANDGKRLSGTESHTITFPANALPPASAFWSLTLYNEHHALHPNEEGRYSIGTRSLDDLVWNDDGSLTIVISKEQPDEDWRSNWIPAPQGEFSLYLRLYEPATAALVGEWSPPPVLAHVPSSKIIVVAETVGRSLSLTGTSSEPINAGNIRE